MRMAKNNGFFIWISITEIITEVLTGNILLAFMCESYLDYQIYTYLVVKVLSKSKQI